MHVAIVGKGIAGLALGDQLVRRGVRVSFFYQSEFTASQAAIGVFSSKGLFLANDSFFAQKLAAQHDFGAWAQELQHNSEIKIPSQQGVQEFFDSPEAYRALRSRIYRNQFTGAFDVEVRHWRGGNFFYYPQDYWIDAQTFLTVLEKSLQKKGASFLAEAVDSVTANTVVTGAKTYSFSHVVLAAGVGTSALLRQSGLLSLPAQQRPGWTLRYRLDGAGENPSFLLKKGRTSLVAHDGFLSVGPFDRDPQPEEESALLAEAKMRCSALSSFSLVQRTCAHGIRVRTPHGAPYLGALAIKGGERVFVSFGYDKSGFLLARSSAQQLADVICAYR